MAGQRRPRLAARRASLRPLRPPPLPGRRPSALRSARPAAALAAGDGMRACRVQPGRPEGSEARVSWAFRPTAQGWWPPWQLPALPGRLWRPYGSPPCLADYLFSLCSSWLGLPGALSYPLARHRGLHHAPASLRSPCVSTNLVRCLSRSCLECAAPKSVPPVQASARRDLPDRLLSLNSSSCARCPGD